MNMQRTNLAEKAREVLEEGAAQRPIYVPRGAPLRAYQEWLASTDSKPTGRDNFCHYSRVVAKVYFGRLRTFIRSHDSIRGVTYGLLIAVLAVLVAMAGLVGTVVSTVAWTYVWAGAFLAAHHHSKRSPVGGEDEVKVDSRPFAFVKRHAWFFAPPFALFYVLLWPFYTGLARQLYRAFGDHGETLLAWAFIVFMGVSLISLGWMIYGTLGGGWIALGAYIGALMMVVLIILYREKTKPAREAKAQAAKAAAEARELARMRQEAAAIYGDVLRKWYDDDEGIREREPDFQAFLTRVIVAHVASGDTFLYEGFLFASNLMLKFGMPAKYYPVVNGAATRAGEAAKQRLADEHDRARVTPRTRVRFADTRGGKILVGIRDFMSWLWAWIRVFKWWYACPFIEIPVAASDEESKVKA